MSRPCGEIAAKGPDEVWSCGFECPRVLPCGHTNCSRKCHPQAVPCLPPGGTCLKKVTRACACGAVKVTAQCASAPSTVPCDELCAEKRRAAAAAAESAESAAAAAAASSAATSAAAAATAASAARSRKARRRNNDRRGGGRNDRASDDDDDDDDGDTVSTAARVVEISSAWLARNGAVIGVFSTVAALLWFAFSVGSAIDRERPIEF
jgi:pyruvate/2-oxoglutarate dehydrogenase complex dihydrolipoamide acyltransferase (E2) component